jgi:fatty-acyl-CoA synthase
MDTQAAPRRLTQLRSQLSGLREQIADLPDRIRVVTRVAKQSGLIWEMSFRGARAAAAALIGTPNPSQIYRVLAANSPAKVGLLWHDESFTFAELDAKMDRLASGLKRRGLARGAVVVMMKNRPEFVLMGGATTRIGCSAVSVSWRSTAGELAYLAAHCGAKGICFDAELWPVVQQATQTVPGIRPNLIIVGSPPGDSPPGCTRFEDLLHERTPFVADPAAEEDAAVVIYTSGTTGKPKGAVRKFPRDTMPAALRFVAETPMRVDDIHLVPCPLYHSTAFGFVALSYMLGATAVLMDEFKPEALLQHVQRFGVTTTAVVPTMLHRILALGPEVLGRYNTRSLRVIFSGGAPLPAPLAVAVMDYFGDILYNFYGATETGLVTLASPRDLRAAPGTIGRVVPGNEIRLLDSEGREVKRGQVGELYVRNKLLVAGYHNDAEATRASMRDGFFSVGDLARQDSAGLYFVEGRKRDMIISGGVNVYPAEVESVLEGHPDLSEVAVVGVEDPEWGERVRAFVVRKGGSRVGEAEIKAWARERLAGPKIPRDIFFFEALPRNPTGKVLKRELRAWRPE